jgi:hypothetical protein
MAELAEVYALGAVEVCVRHGAMGVYCRVTNLQTVHNSLTQATTLSGQLGPFRI